MLKSLGAVKVAVSGTPVRSTLNQSNPSARLAAHSLLVEQLAANTGKIYIGTLPMDITNPLLPGVSAVLPPPTANTIASFSATISYAPGGFNMAEIYIDADVSGEGALVSIIQA